MSCCRYILYLAMEGKNHWLEITPDLRVDLSFYASMGRTVEIVRLTPPLPVGVAYYLMHKVEKSRTAGGRMREILSSVFLSDLAKDERLITQKLSLVQSELGRLGYIFPVDALHITAVICKGYPRKTILPRLMIACPGESCTWMK